MYRKRFASWEEAKGRLRKPLWAPWTIKSTQANLRERKRGTNESARLNTRQFFTPLKPADLKRALEKLGVKKTDGPVITAAAFIGKTPRALRNAGYKAAFTDLGREFVELAKKGETISKGGKIIKAKPIKEAFVMDMENPHIIDTKTSAIISFEPTSLFWPKESRQTVAMNLGPKNGLITLVSKAEEDMPLNIKYAADLNNPYAIDVKKVSVNAEVDAYQVKVGDKQKDMYLGDRKVFETLKQCGSPSETARKLKIKKEEILERAKRFKNAFNLEWV